MYRASEYIDELKLRLARLGVSLELDDQTLLTFVNDARRQVQAETLSTHEPYYTKWVHRPISTTPAEELQPVDNSVLGYQVNWYPVEDVPEDLIRPVVVIVRYQVEGIVYRSEARYAAGLEHYNVSIHSWNPPSLMRPVYMWERATSVSVYPRILIAGIQLPPDGAVVEEPQAELIYVARVSWLEDIPGGVPGQQPDLDTEIRPDLQELVIWYAMLYCLTRLMASQDILKMVMEHIEFLKAMVKVSTEERKRVELFLPSREPLP
jgi:hypothetical protein